MQYIGNRKYKYYEYFGYPKIISLFLKSMYWTFLFIKYLLYIFLAGFELLFQK